MGRYFRMSRRFHKSAPEDFGLVFLDADTVKDPEDGSVWKRCTLYDFGWGPENGYFKEPLPTYDQLLQIALESPDEDDSYGAAAIIMKQYPELLLETCEAMLADAQGEPFIGKLVSLFQLKSGRNLCPVVGKTLSQIESDAYRWRSIADALSQQKDRKCLPWKK